MDLGGSKMSGQDATKSVAEVKAQIKRTECGVGDHQGPKGSSSTSVTTMKKETKHQGK
jgi:hypothetical protein